MDSGESTPWFPDDGQYSDRMAASIINVQLPYIFSTSAVGFVLHPSVFRDAIWCSCAADCNSMGSGGHGCDGGWAFYGAAQLRQMMDSQIQHMHWYSACAWGVTASDRSGCRYNEVILKGWTWRSHLPETIEAFFYPQNGVVNHREGSRTDAQNLHRRFLADYHLTEQDVPLLSFDVAKAGRGQAPFALG